MRVRIGLIVAVFVFLILSARLIFPLHLSFWPSLGLAALLATVVGAMLLHPLSWFIGGSLRAFARRPPIRALSYLSMAFVSILFTVVIARDVLGLFGLFDGEDAARKSSIAVVLISLVLLAWGWIQVRLGPRTKHVKVAIKELPEELDGFRIVQLSDIHIGETVRRPHIEKLVEQVNAIEADLVAITGDLVDGSVPQLREHAAPLASLVSKHGTFFVPGNHEHYSGLGAWMPHLESLGFHVLENEHRLITKGERALLVAGVDDFSMTDDPADDVRRALEGAPRADVRILLAHQPKSAHVARDRFHLQLSGHTHGGQFLPWNFLARFVHAFSAGLYQVGEMSLYVSRGTFYWGPPVRLFAPAEIAVVEISRSPGG